MGKIMVGLIRLHRLVEIFASHRMPRNAELEWRMVLGTIPERRGSSSPRKDMEAVCSVFLTIPLNSLGENGEAKSSVTLTAVQDICIQEDGRFFWHEWLDGEKAEELPLAIAEALVTGKHSGRNYQHNHFPRLAPAQET